MLLNHSETDRKKGAVRGRESRNQSLNTKLTPTEFAAVQVAPAAHGCAIGEWVRDVILRELREGSASDPSLAEILGVRLLLVNVLRPLAAGQTLAPEAFDKLLDEIRHRHPTETTNGLQARRFVSDSQERTICRNLKLNIQRTSLWT